MTTTEFETLDIPALIQELKRPIFEIILFYFDSGIKKPTKIAIKVAENDFILMKSEMTSISDRVEIGKILFNKFDFIDQMKSECDSFTFKFKHSYIAKSIISLNININGAFHFAGVRILDEYNNEMVFCPGDYPYTIYAELPYIKFMGNIPEYSKVDYTEIYL